MKKFWQTYEFVPKHLSQVQSFLKNIGAQPLASNSAWYHYNGDYKNTWIVTVLPEHKLVAYLDKCEASRWLKFPQEKIECGSLQKPRWSTLREAIKRTNFHKSAWSYGFSRYWIVFPAGERKSLGNALKSFREGSPS